MNAIFIIEHLEPEIGAWTLIEYQHISKIVEKENLWFTNTKTKKDQKLLALLGRVFTQSVKNLNLANACILDPEAPQLLTFQKAAHFKYFIFGGILGDHPPKKRTRKELTQFLPSLPKFNIGTMQMSTDNAVYTVKQITKGILFENIPFKDEIEIRINKVESTILPYRYALIKGKPLMRPALLKYLKTH